MTGERAGARGRSRLAGLAVVLVALAAAGATPAAADPPPDFPWPDLLPPLPTVANPQPGPQDGCQKPSMACVDLEIKRMQEAQDRFGCDHRAVFATTYLTLTQALKRTVTADPRFFADPDYFFYEDALFANFYFRTLDRYAAGQPVPDAWAIAFQTAASGDANAAQDMLLGINAHVQRDMPYVLASLGLHRPDGSSRKLDHDRANDVLNNAYNAVVRAIADRYDPMVNTTNPGTPGDNLAGLELVKVWRENVWRNAERLLNATTDQQRRDVESSIETNAADSARSIAAAQGPPGYRAVRDAYCQGRLSRPASAPGAATGTGAARRRRHHRRHHRVAMRHRRTAHRHAARAQRSRKSELLGHSVQGRPIRVTRVGDPNASRSVLVFGQIHGEEPAGRAIVAELARRAAPRGVQLWLVSNLNPDGAAHHTRHNAHGVDLNRNFPVGWRSLGPPGSVNYSGPRPLSEPETRLARRLILRVRPQITLWYHQPLGFVDRTPGADPVIVRRYSFRSHLHRGSVAAPPGCASRWQEHVFPRASAFVVELPAGPLRARAVLNHAHAVEGMAADLAAAG